MIDIHATGLTPSSYTAGSPAGSLGTLSIDVSNAAGYTTQIPRGSGPVIGGGGTYDLKVTFASNNTLTLGTAGSTGLGFKLTAPQSQTVTAAVGATGTWQIMTGNLYMTIGSYLLNGLPGVANGLMIEIDNFNPGTQITNSGLTLQSDVVVLAADVPLPNTAKSLVVLLSATGLWAIRRRGQLA